MSTSIAPGSRSFIGTPVIPASLLGMAEGWDGRVVLPWLRTVTGFCETEGTRGVATSFRSRRPRLDFRMKHTLRSDC